MEQIFPEALLHELLQGMVHSDVETRAMVHHIFSLLLVRSLLISKPEDLHATQSWAETSSVLSRSSSVFSSTAACFKKLGREKYGFAGKKMCFDSCKSENIKGNIDMAEMGVTKNEDQGNVYSSPSPRHGFKVSEAQSWEVSMDNSTALFSRPSNSTKDLVSSKSVSRCSFDGFLH